jgi:hypothetical protein
MVIHTTVKYGQTHIRIQHSYSGCMTQNRVLHFLISIALRVTLLAGFFICELLADLPLHGHTGLFI